MENEEIQLPSKITPLVKTTILTGLMIYGLYYVIFKI